MMNTTIIISVLPMNIRNSFNAIQKIVTGCPYKQGCLIESPTTILSDDFVYSQSGVPTIISYRPIGEKHLKTYQTNYDVIHNHFSLSSF